MGFGYAFNRSFSIEVAYNQFGDGSDDIWTDPEVILHTEVSSFSIAAQGGIPLGDNFLITGRAGIERMDGEFEYELPGFDHIEKDDDNPLCMFD